MCCGFARRLPKVYGIPVDYYPWAVFYRKSVFQSKNYTIPATWTDLKALCTKMQSDGLTPIAFGEAHIAALRAVGLDALAISDVIHGAAFFNWANRLMLSLGEPAGP